METSSSPGQSMAPSNSLPQVMRRHPLLFFYLMTYAFAWLAWLPLILSQGGRPLSPLHRTLIIVLITDLTLFVPTLSAFIMTNITEGKSGIGRLRRRYVLWRVGFWWYLFVLIGFPALILLSMLVLPGAIPAFRAPDPGFGDRVPRELRLDFHFGWPTRRGTGMAWLCAPTLATAFWPSGGNPHLRRTVGPLAPPFVPDPRIQWSRNEFRRHQHSFHRVRHRYHSIGGHRHLGLQ